MSTCEKPPIRQISTGAEDVTTNQQLVNRDLEQLFQRVNDMQTCLNKVSQYLTSQSSGSFAGGDGSTSGKDGSGAGASLGSGSQLGPGAMLVQRISTGTDYTVPYDFTGVLLIDATADLSVTLCPPVAGRPITIMHVGAGHTVTVKDDLGSSLSPTIMTMGTMYPRQLEDSSNAPTWASGAMVIYPSGIVNLPSDLVVTDASKGLVLLDSGGNYYRYTSVAGALSPADTGSSITPH